MANTDWKYIQNEEDIEKLLEIVNYFHDSCIKEIKYISGSFINKDQTMHTIDNLRNVSVIMQLPSDDNAIELEFEEIERLNLVPSFPNYSSKIFEAFIFIYNGYIYFSQFECEVGDLEASSEENSWIKGKRLKWRFNEEYLGSEVIYVNNK